MKKLREKIAAVVASTIITGLVIAGMLAVGVDAVRNANNTVASNSGSSVSLETTDTGTATALNAP